MMMKTFVKFLKAKKDKTEEDLEQIRIMSSSYDISDIKYIEPIIDYLNSCLNKFKFAEQIYFDNIKSNWNTIISVLIF